MVMPAVSGTGLDAVKIPTRPARWADLHPHSVQVLFVAHVAGGGWAHQSSGPTAVGCVRARRGDRWVIHMAAGTARSPTAVHPPGRSVAQCGGGERGAGGPESGTSTPSTCRAGCGARLGESRHGRRRGTDKGQERQREGEAGSPCDHWRALHCRGEQASVQPRPSARCHAAAVTRSSRSAAGKQCACGRRRLPGATVPRRRRAALVQRVPDGPGAVGSGPGSGRAERLGPCCVGSLSCRASVKIRPYGRVTSSGPWTGS